MGEQQKKVDEEYSLLYIPLNVVGEEMNIYEQKNHFKHSSIQ